MQEIDANSRLEKHPLLQNVVRLRPRDRARLVHMITQEDLENNLRLQGELAAAAKALKNSDRYIKVALRSGAVIEHGARRAWLKQIKRKPQRMKGCEYSRLFVR